MEVKNQFLFLASKGDRRLMVERSSGSVATHNSRAHDPSKKLSPSASPKSNFYYCYLLISKRWTRAVELTSSKGELVSEVDCLVGTRASHSL